MAAAVLAEANYFGLSGILAACLPYKSSYSTALCPHPLALTTSSVHVSAFAGLANILEQSKGQELVKTAQLYDAKLTSCASAPVKYAAVQAAASSIKPQLTQASTHHRNVLPTCLLQGWHGQHGLLSCLA